MIDDLKTFIETQSEENDNFKFWTQFIEIVSLIHDVL